jgi:5-methylcytosine-specific restriction endonuclease McrA
MTQFPRISLTPEIREFIFQRDRYRCQHCDRPFPAQGTPKHLEVDHILPLSQGGTNDLSNLQTLCRRCNRRKRDRRDRNPRHYS